MHPFVSTPQEIAIKAGRYITHRLDRLDLVKTSEKAHNDFVTDVDQKAEEIIIDGLKTAYPKHSILGEESGSLVGEDPSHEWVIDPLDGTTNFTHGIPHFAVSIALRKHGKLESAVIYDPIRQECFTALRGHGAMLNNQRVRVTRQQKMAGALLGTGFPFRNPEFFETYMKIFTDFFPKTRGVRRAGAATLDLAYVAAGRLDGFWEYGLKPWDMAAGALLVKEAGGLVGDFSGLGEYMDKQQIIAANPKIFKALIQTIRPHIHI